MQLFPLHKNKTNMINQAVNILLWLSEPEPLGAAQIPQHVLRGYKIEIQPKMWPPVNATSMPHPSIHTKYHVISVVDTYQGKFKGHVISFLENYTRVENTVGVQVIEKWLFPLVCSISTFVQPLNLEWLRYSEYVVRTNTQVKSTCTRKLRIIPADILYRPVFSVFLCSFFKNYFLQWIG